jgi:LPS-assembly protein
MFHPFTFDSTKDCSPCRMSARVVRVAFQMVCVCIGAVTMHSFEMPRANAQSTVQQFGFSEDSKAEKSAQQAAVQQATKPKLVPKAPEGLDFQAPEIEFKKDTHEIVGKGGVMISEGGVQVQADEGTFNTETKIGEVSGHVLMTSGEGVVSADSGTVNVEAETGEFSNIQFDVEEGGYRVNAEKARKISEFEFDLEDSDMTTCRCKDGSKPWSIVSDSCRITQGGYAHAYGSKVYFEGLPILYAPYMVFPVKHERSSGLLPGQMGMSNQNGFQFSQPIFLSVDESTGFTVTPFVATKSRYGSDFTFEKVFSETHSLNAGFLYSNESWRGDSLRGLNVSGISDPTIDTNRFGTFYKQNWISDKNAEAPIEFIADGHYTSDNLFLREIVEPNIGSPQAQWLVSTGLVRGTALSAINLESRVEYNEMLIQPQDTQFQRLPEFAASTTRTFRPFGMNPLGLKLVTSADSVITDFVRQDGYDGWRIDIHPKVAVPFHVENYVRSQAAVELHQTEYNLRNTMLPAGATPLPDGSTELASSESRTLPIFTYGMSSGMERVYALERDNWLSKVVGMGIRNEGYELTKLKHTIEPMVSYAYVPDVDQTYNPSFDQLDRFRQRSLVTYGVTTRLYGRFHEPYERTREVEDLTSVGQTIPMFDMTQSMMDFGRGMILAPEKLVDTREGEIRELGNLYLRQGYDFVEAREDLDPSTDGFTDWNPGFVLSPSYYLSAAADANISQQSSDLSSYSVSLGFRDDRQDMLRTRYTFVNNVVSQIEGNLELTIGERLRAGAYARYDAEGGELIQGQGLLRYLNSCKCWSVDLGLGQTNSPAQKQFLLSFNFGGVGSIRQGMSFAQ